MAVKDGGEDLDGCGFKEEHRAPITTKPGQGSLRPTVVGTVDLTTLLSVRCPINAKGDDEILAPLGVLGPRLAPPALKPAPTRARDGSHRG